MAVIAVLVGIAVASLFRPVSSLPPLELSSHLSAREASVVTESPISSFEIPEVEVYDEDTLNSILEAHYSRKSRLAKRDNSGSASGNPTHLNGKKTLRPSLSQQETNGNSVLGTEDAPHLPKHLGGPMPQGSPWGSRTTRNTNPYTDPPETGVTRHYTFVISQKTLAPDGILKPGLLVNGAFPGPTIEANWGDWIEVTLINKLPDEGTALHWHGLLQKETPYYDGVPSVQMCPVRPGGSFTYRFKADLYGTSWYHSHYSGQYAGGALGAMIIHGPRSADYDIDIGPVILSDWYHSDYHSLVNTTMVAGVPPPSNNNLINGKNNYPCEKATTTCRPNAGLATFRFRSGKKHLLRLINVGSEGIQKFAIDGHTLTVIANDFVPIEPYDTKVVTLGVGQRADVIVKGIGRPSDSFWMRSYLGSTCSVVDGISPNAVAAVYYEYASQYSIPRTQSEVTDQQLALCANDALDTAKPLFSIPASSNPSTSVDINIEFKSNGTNFVWMMNNSTFRGNYNDPVLLEAKLGHTSFDKQRNVYNFGTNETVRLVLYNWFQYGAHPMHLHGHNFQVLAEGWGKWDGSVVNTANPPRRDNQLVAPARDANTPAYIVIQFEQDNRGIWPLHCHIAWHISAGLYLNVLERPDDIRALRIPSTMAQTCREWAQWTGTHVPNQIDSGL